MNVKNQKAIYRCVVRHLVIVLSLFSVFMLPNFTKLCATTDTKIAPDLEVLIPMRDGMMLPTSVYFPKSAETNYQTKTQKATQKPPCVLVRQPLGKEHVDPAWLKLLGDGYVVAIQSTRSSCDTTGTSLPYVTDGWGELSDGYDSIEWLASSSWTNGKVATIGHSATGITQLLLAPANPPHLACQHIEIAAPSLYHYAVWPGGQYRKEQVDGWLQAHKRAENVSEFLRTKIDYDAFWSQFNAIDVTAKVAVPQVHIGGWYDIFSQGTLDAFCAAQELSQGTSKAEHKLIMGPWAHSYKYTQTFGDFDALAAGKAAPKPISYKDWLDYHLKGEKNSLSDTPAVQYYVMGPFDGTPSIGNKWRSAHRWPPDATYMQLYLTKDHALERENIQTEEVVCQVLFDPQRPVPTIGGRNLFIANGPKNLQDIERRKDVVSFTTEVLTEDTEVTGRIAACLFASKVLKERDICLRLSDVYPNGKSILIAEGVSHVKPDEIKGIDTDPQPILIDLWSTSMVFAKGHKIRLTISGSNFPAYDTSLLANPEVLEANTEIKDLCFCLHSGGKHASYVALPILANLETSAS